MKKRFMSSLSVLVLAMTLIFNLSVSAQSKSAAVPSGPATPSLAAAPPASQSSSKQISRAQFMELSGDEQAALLTNLETYNISDLVNATPTVLASRQENVFYVPAADFKNASRDRQYQILKNPSTYIIVQEASQIPKIQISKEQYDAMPQNKKSIIRNSSEYTIVN